MKRPNGRVRGIFPIFRRILYNISTNLYLQGISHADGEALKALSQTREQTR